MRSAANASVDTLQAPSCPLPTVGEQTEVRGRTLDLVERWVVILFVGQLVARLLWTYITTRSPSPLIVLPGELIVLYFLFVRQRTHAISPLWLDWVIATLATLLPTLVAVGESAFRWMPLTLAGSLAIAGLIVQLHAKLSLGRSIGMVAANRGIKEGGAYRYVRHPMYLGYFLGHLALLGLYTNLWNVTLLTIAAVLQILRILREEHWLSSDPVYCAYKERVPFRLLPYIF